MDNELYFKLNGQGRNYSHGFEDINNQAYIVWVVESSMIVCDIIKTWSRNDGIEHDFLYAFDFILRFYVMNESMKTPLLTPPSNEF